MKGLLKRVAAVVLSVMLLAVANIPLLHTSAANGFYWPCEIKEHADYPGYYGHTGVDIYAPLGTPIYASKAGTVEFWDWGCLGSHRDDASYANQCSLGACYAGPYGNYVKINHGDGYSTLYAHMKTGILVDDGQWVEAGELLGYSGTSGNSTGPHLHFEVRYNEKAQNPLDYVSPYDFPAPDPDPDVGHIMDESEAAGQTIPDGTYWMASRLQGDYALDIPGTAIMSETCNVGMHIFGGGNFEKYDAWDFKYLGNGFYRIRQHDSKMCLDSKDGTLKQYSNVILYADNGSNAQQWSVERHTAGYKIRCRCSSHLLNVEAGKIANEANECTWPEDGMNDQYWNLIPYVDTSKEVSIKEGTYTFSSKDKDKIDWYMVAKGKSSYVAGTKLQISSQNKDSFEIESASNGYYKIKETTSGLYVAAIKSDNFWDRRNVGLEASSTSRAQLWAIKKNSDGTYYVINKLNGFYLDVNSSSYSEGININEIPLNKDSSFKQKWNISDAIKPTGIKLTSTPTKKTYYEHEKLDTTGLKVTATFDNGTTKDVTADVKFKYDFSTAGETTVTVSYTYAGITKTASYPVTVLKIALLFKGEGTEKSPYLIGSKDALIQMCDLVNDSYYNATYSSAHYALTSDIDLSGVTWVGIGLNEQPFLGTFDGRKHTVKNMTVNAKKKFAGFFGKVNGTAVIENLSVEGTVTNTDRSTGGIVGEIGNSTDGLIVTIRNCSFIGNVSGDLAGAGGIVGCAWQNGIITDCYHIGTVTSKSGYAGGIVGYTEVGELKNNVITIANSYHVGKITGNGGTIVGRTVGNATNGCKITLKNCYALTADGGYAYTPDTKTMDVQQLKSGSLLNAAATEISENMVKNTKSSELNAGYPVFWWQNVTKGDINDDGIINSKDSDIAMDIFLSGGKDASREMLYAADVNEDGFVNATDSAEIIKLFYATVVPGDCNADGKFTIADVVILQKWLLNESTEFPNSWRAADLTDDDELNVFDLVMMKRLLIAKVDAK